MLKKTTATALIFTGMTFVPAAIAAPHRGGAVLSAEAALLMQARVSLQPRAAQGAALEALARVQLVFMAGAAEVLATAAAWAFSTTATTIAVTVTADVVTCTAARQRPAVPTGGTVMRRAKAKSDLNLSLRGVDPEDGRRLSHTSRSGDFSLRMR